MNPAIYSAITIANIASLFVCCTQATLRVVVLVMFSSVTKQLHQLRHTYVLLVLLTG
jgi:hypothetical protein